MPADAVAMLAAFIVPVLGYRALLLWHARVRRRRWLAVPEALAAGAVRGHKVAHVALRGDGPEALFVGVVDRHTYAVEDRAHCRTRGCAAPGLGCDCGFYAFRERADALALRARRGGALLEVDLDGAVLQYERGFRAQRQRVLAVRMAPFCDLCAARGLRSPACAVAVDARCPPPAADEPCVRILGAVCAQHARGRHSLDLGTLAGRLGTEVSWSPGDVR
jgi:hypothetical protein